MQLSRNYVPHVHTIYKTITKLPTSAVGIQGLVNNAT